MRHEAPRPTSSALPLPRVPDEYNHNLASTIQLDGASVARFNDLLHELYPDAPHLDIDAVASVARWLLSLPAAQADAMLQARLTRLSELRELIADRDWQAEPALAHRIDKLLGYVARNDDLIPDDTPLLGRLDDALLVELAWPMVADELEDFHDFSSFREESGQQYGGHPGRDDWLRTRLEEGALWEQLHRVHESRYLDLGPAEAPLRVV